MPKQGQPPGAAPTISGSLKNAELLERRRDELAREATRVFLEKRFDATSVNEIAERCGWSIGSLYRYVASKEDILFLVCAQIFRNLTITDPDEGFDDDPVSAFEAAFGEYCENVYRNRHQVLLMYREYTQLTSDAQAHFQELERRVYRSLAMIVANGVDRGVFVCEHPDLFAVDCVMRSHLLSLKEWALSEDATEVRRCLVVWALRALQGERRGVPGADVSG